MKVKSESEVAKSCQILSDPMDCSPPDSSIHGIFQARVLEWGAIGKKRSYYKIACYIDFFHKLMRSCLPKDVILLIGFYS